MGGTGLGPMARGAGEGPNLGEVLHDYRRDERLTQKQLAGLLNIDQSYVSKIERGRPVRDVDFLRRIADLLGVPAAHLGLSSEPAVHANGADPVALSQERWLTERRYLNQRRHELAARATGFYDLSWRVDRTTLIAPPSWVPAEPVRLEQVNTTWVSACEPIVTGLEPETGHVRPLHSPGHQYREYTATVSYLDRPALFENRPSYQLLDLRWEGGCGQMEFGLATYFEKLNVAEALGHELAAVSRDRAGGQVGIGDLPFRALVGDPFDTARRALLPAVTTLTLRKRRTHGDATFLLHWRDPAKVATAAGIYDVIPAGEFQPSSMSPFDQENDFDIWRSIVREYSEELLGEPERDGSQSAPIDYDGWRFNRSLQSARDEGKLLVYCLGAGVDALTLAPTILTVAVFDDEVFDAAFRDVVEVNTEGKVVFGHHDSTEHTGLPFEATTVQRLLEREPMASPGAACLSLAWRHRIALLTG